MKRVSIFFSMTCLLWVSLGDEIQVVEKTSTIDESPVLDEVVYQQGKDTLTIQRIEQPEFLEEIKVIQAPSAEELEAQKAALPLSATFVISATAHDSKGTKIEVWPSHIGQQGALEGWSNVNWEYFQNLLAVEGDGKRYNFMLFHSKPNAGRSDQELSAENLETEAFSEVPTELPRFEEGGARYLVTSALETEREDTLAFLETLHVLYDEHHQELRENREEAVQEHADRKRQIEKEAKKPKKRVLRIWRHNSKKVETNEQ